jgi:hypothetical protein
MKEGISFRFYVSLSIHWSQIMSGKTPFNLGHNAGALLGLTGPKLYSWDAPPSKLECRLLPLWLSSSSCLFLCNKVQSYIRVCTDFHWVISSVLLCLCSAQPICTCRGTQNDYLLGKATVFTKVHKQDNAAMSREFETSAFTFPFSRFVFNPRTRSLSSMKLFGRKRIHLQHQF